MPYSAPSLLKPLLTCWVLAAISVIGAIYYVLSFYLDPGHSQEYLVGATMVLSWTVPVCLVVSIVCVVKRRSLSRRWQYFLNSPSAICASVVMAMYVAPPAVTI